MTGSSLADLGLLTVVLLVAVALAAGWVDAVVGGGGLLQLPVLLLVPGVAPVQALATNKIASACGTTASAVTYHRRVRPDLRTALLAAVVAGAGSSSGALFASMLAPRALTAVVLVALVVVGAYTLARPQFGGEHRPRFSGHRHLAAAAVVGLVVGGYDGLAGPGTGAFLVFGLVGLVGMGFLQATATAKIINLATNLAALAVFATQGVVLWELGAVMGAANLLGGYLGARTAIAAGNVFVRRVFLVVVAVLVVRLAHQLLTGA